MEKIRLGISRCLLGESVRYDGGHTFDPFLCHTLGQYAEYVSVCPEMECGLPAPREPMNLVGEAQRPRLVTVHTRQDLTRKMRTWIAGWIEASAPGSLDGFILKEKSPSCGVSGVPVHDAEMVPQSRGSGLFARALADRFPLLPVEGEGRLQRVGPRENFIDRIFVLRRWRRVAPGCRRAELATFHAEHQLLLRAHSPELERVMGRRVEQGELAKDTELFNCYEGLLLEALHLHTTIDGHCGVLEYVMSYLKKELSSHENQEVLSLIDSYREGRSPLIVPLTVINRYARRADQPDLLRQRYLCPGPLELLLRNHA